MHGTTKPLGKLVMLLYIMKYYISKINFLFSLGNIVNVSSVIGIRPVSFIGFIFNNYVTLSCLYAKFCSRSTVPRGHSGGFDLHGHRRVGLCNFGELTYQVKI